MRQCRKSRLCYIIPFCFIIIIGLNIYLWHMKKKIPDKIFLTVNEETELVFETPVQAVFEANGKGKFFVNDKKVEEKTELKKDNKILCHKTGNYSADISLFGLLNLKKVDLNVVEEKEVIAGGYQVGVYVETNGVMVLKTGKVRDIYGMESTPAENIINTGDYIISVNDTIVRCRDDVVSAIQRAEEDKVVLKVKRGNEEIKVLVNRVLCSDNLYRIGLWIRDNMQGIGTMTYVDKDGSYGALGHGISDVDIGNLMEVGKGSIYNARIINIIKGYEKMPGELVGLIEMTENMKIGEIVKNNENGIFGKVDLSKIDDKYKTPLKIGYKQEVKEGKAYIRCMIEDNIKDYEVEIKDIKYNSGGNKNFVINVIDEDLINKTNGILQGMSGSPVIQNGKLIGAVTHVFVDNPHKGYGILIEHMLSYDL